MDIFINRLHNLLNKNQYFTPVIGENRETMLNAYIEIVTELESVRNDPNLSSTLTTSSKKTPESEKLIRLMPLTGLNPDKGPHKEIFNEFISNAFSFLFALEDLQDLTQLTRDNYAQQIFLMFSQFKRGRKGAKSTFIGDDYSEDHFAGLIYSFVALKADCLFDSAGNIINSETNERGMTLLNNKIRSLQLPRIEGQSTHLERR